MLTNVHSDVSMDNRFFQYQMNQFSASIGRAKSFYKNM